MTAKGKMYWTLFTSTLYISAVTFGSGYVIVSVIKKRFVDELKWVDEEEMVNLITLAQSSPGVMAANTALLVGYKTGGAIGSALAVLGVALPPLLTIYIISLFYAALRDNALVGAILRGMQAGACAVILGVVSDLFLHVVKDKGLRFLAKFSLMLGAFALAFVLHVSFIVIVLLFILVGAVWHFVGRRGKGHEDDAA